MTGTRRERTVLSPVRVPTISVFLVSAEEDFLGRAVVIRLSTSINVTQRVLPQNTPHNA